MKQSRNPINPRLNVGTAAPVQYYDGARVHLDYVLDQRILLFRKAERPVVAFTLVLIVRANSENNGIIAGECRGRP